MGGVGFHEGPIAVFEIETYVGLNTVVKARYYINVRSSSNVFAVPTSRDWGREGDAKVRIFSAWLTQLLIGLGLRFFPTSESTNQDSQPSGGKKDSSIEFS